jgi:hypothetical protein
MLFAQEAKQGDPIIPDKPPLPATPVILPIPKLEIVRYYTEPAQVRAQEPFVLYLEIKNVGAAPAVDYTVQNSQCTGAPFVFEDMCTKPIPMLQVSESTTIQLHLRYVDKIDENAGKAISLSLDFYSKSATPTPATLSIFVLPSRRITDETPVLQRPFSRPNLIVHRSWTAKARGTVADLLTEVPLAITAGLPSDIAGGPEFELVVELQNQGQGEAANIFINFCTTSDNFNPVYSSCRKQVPTTLGPGANAIASQTLAYKNIPTPPTQAARGDKVVVGVTYEFWYVDQWLRETITHEVYLYPQPFPALTPIPAAMKDKQDLVVNTPQLNVRYGPGTLYPIVGVTYQGISHEVTGKDTTGEWWQINFNNSGQAWVYAHYVIVRGAEAVEIAEHIPDPPPFPAQPLPIPQPNRDPVGAVEPQATLIPVGMPPTLQNSVTPIPTSFATPPAALLQVNYQERPSAAANTASAGGRTPLIIIEHYQTMPIHLQSGQPFQLDLVLRNISGQRVQQLLLGWQGGPIVPLAAGAMRWLDNLPAGASTTVTGQFMLTAQNVSSVIQLPVQILYTDEQGQLVQYTEMITLLSTAGEPNPLPTPTPPAAERPLWLRFFFGLLGLGAEPQ